MRKKNSIVKAMSDQKEFSLRNSDPDVLKRRASIQKERRKSILEGRAQQKTSSLIGKILPEDVTLPESLGVNLGQTGPQTVKPKWIILTVIACFLLLFIGTLKFAMLI